MDFDFATLTPRDKYKLLVSTIVPRPIAWVVTMNSAGLLNAAPFSFFNAFAGDPPTLGIGMAAHAPDRPKDSRRNIAETKQFVVNLVTVASADAMNITATPYDYGVDELATAGLTTLPSLHVKPPRIAASPVSFECELMQTIELGPSNVLILGRVLGMHIDDEMMLDPARLHVDTPKLDLVGRMHGSGWYSRTSDLFELERREPGTKGLKSP